MLSQAEDLNAVQERFLAGIKNIVPPGNDEEQGPDAVKTAIKELHASASLLDEVHAFLGRFVAYPSEHAHVAHTLWIVHTHFMDAWESTPRIAFLSPEPGSGKTRALEVTETLVPRPVEAVNVTPAYLFRKVSHPTGLPTILFDEVDTLFGPRAREHEEIRGILNAGHRRGAMAGRCVVKGKTVETEELPAFCAVALAGLGKLPDTILTRSVIVKMRRRAQSETVESYRRRLHAPEGNQLRDKLSVWANEVRSRLNPYPDLPDGITDRPADVWESLLSVADAAGGEWPNRSRVAAVALVGDAVGGQPSLGIQLLKDIQVVMGQRDSVWTEDLLNGLINLEEAPWGDLRGKSINNRQLADFLRPYGVQSEQVKLNGTNKRGYKREAFHDAWKRYLTPEIETGEPHKGGATSATNTTASTKTEETDSAPSPPYGAATPATEATSPMQTVIPDYENGNEPQPPEVINLC